MPQVIELEFNLPQETNTEFQAELPAVGVGKIQYIKRNGELLPVVNHTVDIKVPESIQIHFTNENNRLVADQTLQYIRNIFNSNGFVLGIYNDKIYELNDIQSGYYKFVNMDDEIIRTITYSNVELEYKEIDYKCKINWEEF